MRPGLLDFLIDLAALLLGFSALLYGVWQVYQPAAWILGGLMLLGYALQAARVRASAPESQ